MKPTRSQLVLVTGLMGRPWGTPMAKPASRWWSSTAGRSSSRAPGRRCRDGLECQHDLAASASALELGERLAKLGEGIGLVHDWPQPAVVDPGADLGELGTVGAHEQIGEARTGPGGD